MNTLMHQLSVKINVSFSTSGSDCASLIAIRKDVGSRLSITWWVFSWPKFLYLILLLKAHKPRPGYDSATSSFHKRPPNAMFMPISAYSNSDLSFLPYHARMSTYRGQNYTVQAPRSSSNSFRLQLRLMGGVFHLSHSCTSISLCNLCLNSSIAVKDYLSPHHVHFSTFQRNDELLRAGQKSPSQVCNDLSKSQMNIQVRLKHPRSTSAP